MKDVGRAKLDRRPNCRRTDPIASHPLTNPIACRKTPQHEGGGGGRIAADESFELQRVGTFEHHPTRLRAPASRRTTISRSGRLYRGLAGFQSSSTSAPASPEKAGDYALHTTTKFFPPRAPDAADRRCKAFRSAPPRRVRPTLPSRPAQSGADRAGALDDASVMRLDRRIDQISPQATQPRQRAIFVRFREPAVADHVGGARPPVAQPDVMIFSLASFETDHLKSLDCRGVKIASHSKKSRCSVAASRPFLGGVGLCHESFRPVSVIR